MKIVEFPKEAAEPIELFNSVAASSIPLGHGDGEAHVYCVYIEAGGAINRHEAGFGQLFLIIHGTGWAEGDDGQRVNLKAGQGIYFERGEHHAKGSDSGMTAIMVQVKTLTPANPQDP
ncbi:MAG: AraC family ligand binding domain-containing protein [Pseudomonadota bacterium]